MIVKCQQACLIVNKYIKISSWAEISGCASAYSQVFWDLYLLFTPLCQMLTKTPCNLKITHTRHIQSYNWTFLAMIIFIHLNNKMLSILTDLHLLSCWYYNSITTHIIPCRSIWQSMLSIIDTAFYNVHVIKTHRGTSEFFTASDNGLVKKFPFLPVPCIRFCFLSISLDFKVHAKGHPHLDGWTGKIILWFTGRLSVETAVMVCDVTAEIKVW